MTNADTIEAMRAENGRLHMIHSQDMNDLVMMGMARDEAYAEITRLKAESDAMRAALEPFADIADLLDSETEGLGPTDEFTLYYGEDHSWLAARFTVLQFIKARAALNPEAK